MPKLRLDRTRAAKQHQSRSLADPVETDYQGPVAARLENALVALIAHLGTDGQGSEAAVLKEIPGVSGRVLGAGRRLLLKVFFELFWSQEEHSVDETNRDKHDARSCGHPEDEERCITSTIIPAARAELCSVVASSTL